MREELSVIANFEVRRRAYLAPDGGILLHLLGSGARASAATIQRQNRFGCARLRSDKRDHANEPDRDDGNDRAELHGRTNYSARGSIGGVCRQGRDRWLGRSEN